MTGAVWDESKLISIIVRAALYVFARSDLASIAYNAGRKKECITAIDYLQLIFINQSCCKIKVKL